jgi:3-hydroxyacyl-CoA dehydrogenase
LIDGMPDSFARDFMITHFFNPPRYMRLLELIVGDKTRPDAVAAVRAFCDVTLGKGVVQCNDTPGFIANRIGTFWLQCGVNEPYAKIFQSKSPMGSCQNLWASRKQACSD